MKKPKEDAIREKRIDNEVVVDCYGPEEVAMGWYYYLSDTIQFPFKARCVALNPISPLKNGETIEVQRMAPTDACLADMFALISWHGRTMAVPLSQLIAINADDSTTQALGDWHYWVGQGFSF